jgi:hypothetical protein
LEQQAEEEIGQPVLWAMLANARELSCAPRDQLSSCSKDRCDDGAQVYLLEYLERAADREGQGPTGQDGKKNAIGLAQD